MDVTFLTLNSCQPIQQFLVHLHPPPPQMYPCWGGCLYYDSVLKVLKAPLLHPDGGYSSHLDHLSCVSAEYGELTGN